MTYIFLFFLWLCFWSFWSVLTSRLGKFSLIDIWEWKKDFRKAVESILIWRSACPHCKHTLWAMDLVPIVSYFTSWWKCRYCHKKISWIYPLLEIGCGLLFVWVGYFTMQTDMSQLQIVLWITVSWLLYLLMIYDINTSFLHETIWIKAVVVTIVLLALSKWFLWYYAIERGIFFFAFFLWIYYLAKRYVRIRWKKDWEWFGIWDVRLSPIIWCLFGLIQIRHTNSPLFIEWITMFQRYIIIAWVTWILYAWWHKAIFPDESIHEIPFFPWMIIGLLVMMALV